MRGTTLDATSLHKEAFFLGCSQIVVKKVKKQGVLQTN